MVALTTVNPRSAKVRRARGKESEILQRERYGKEYARKAIHVLFTAFLALFAWLTPDPVQRIGYILLLLLGITASAVARNRRVPFLSTGLELFERRHERVPGRGPLMLVAAVLLLSFLVNDLLLVSGLIVIGIGDPLGFLLGRSFGRISIPWDRSKHIEGRIIAAGICWLLLWLLWHKTLMFHFYSWWVLPTGVVAGMVAESLPWRRVGLDDNFLVPLVTALVLYALV